MVYVTLWNGMTVTPWNGVTVTPWNGVTVTLWNGVTIILWNGVTFSLYCTINHPAKNYISPSKVTTDQSVINYSKAISIYIRYKTGILYFIAKSCTISTRDRHTFCINTS